MQKAIKLETIKGERVIMGNTLEDLNRERERKEVIFSRQQAEAELAMTLLLKEEEEEANKAMAGNKAQKSKKGK